MPWLYRHVPRGAPRSTGQLTRAIARRTSSNDRSTFSGSSRRTSWSKSGYLGNQGHHLDRVVIVNQAVPKTGPTDNSSTASRRPFPKFGPIQQVEASFDNANYNAAPCKLTQRFQQGPALHGRAIPGQNPSTTAAPFVTTPETLFGRPTATISAPNADFHNLTCHAASSPLISTICLLGRAGALLPGLPQPDHWRLAIRRHSHPCRRHPLSTCAQLGDTAGLGNFGQSARLRRLSPVPSNRTVNHFWNPAAFNYTNPALS